MAYEYCKIFVQHGDTGRVKDMIATLLGGRFYRNTLYLTGLAVDVRRNPDAMPTPGADDDFVHWPLTVELDAEDEAGQRIILVTADRILRSLWDSGHPAVAACDFEDELPWKGGIQRLGS